MLRQSKRSSSSVSSPPATPSRSAESDERPQYNFSRRRVGFWGNPMNAVAIFTGSFAFAAGLTMSMLNHTTQGGTVWYRLLMGARTTTSRSILSVPGSSKGSPIILMGLPKSGAESIHNFFMCNRIKSSHYCCDNASPSNDYLHMKFPCGKDQFTCGSCVLNNMQMEKPPFEGCGEYQVWSQFDVETSEPFSWFLPQHRALPLIHEAHPESPIILNRRLNAEDWADSVLHWHSMTTRFFESFGLDIIKKGELSPKKEITYENLMSDMQTSLDRASSENEWQRKRRLLAKVYDDHNEKVRLFAREYNHPFMEVIVDDPTLGVQLAEDFQLSATCWSFNATEYESDWKNFSLPF